MVLVKTVFVKLNSAHIHMYHKVALYTTTWSRSVGVFTQTFDFVFSIL